jgi:hypothetical protein
MIVKHQIRRGLFLGAAYLLAAVAVNELRRRDLVGADATTRLMGILGGLIVLVLANEIPKRLMPLERLHCDPVREQTLRRLAARVMVLGSLGCTLAYAFAPLAIAPTLAVWLLGPPYLVFAGILARCAWVRRRAKRSDA